MKQKREFGELETAIIRIIHQNQELTIGEVQKKMGDNTAYTTVQTVMNRLVEKKKLIRKKNGRSYVYSIHARSNEKEAFSLQKLFFRRFMGDATKMISCFLQEEEEISYEDLEKIEKIIQKAKREKRK